MIPFPMKPAMLALLVLAGAGCVATPPAPAPVVLAPAPAAKPAEPVLDAAGKARVEARLRALEPEFWTRRSRDGEAAANEWLRKQAVEISREEARKGATG